MAECSLLRMMGRTWLLMERNEGQRAALWIQGLLRFHSTLSSSGSPSLEPPAKNSRLPLLTIRPLTTTLSPNNEAKALKDLSQAPLFLHSSLWLPTPLPSPHRRLLCTDSVCPPSDAGGDTEPPIGRAANFAAVKGQGQQADGVSEACEWSWREWRWWNGQ